MAFMVWHEEWGNVDSTLLDLGCGKSWDTVHQARPRAPLTCRECRHTMTPVRSPRGLRFFRHGPRVPQCALAGGESIEHHMLKLELAQAARAAGFHAEYEVAAPDRSWRADVMATSADGTRRVALEAQLSPITPESIQARTDRYERDGVAVCWFGVALSSWAGRVPSLLVSPPDAGRAHWAVSAGIARMLVMHQGSSFQQWVSVEDVNLTDAVAWILNGRMGAHRPLSKAKAVHDSDGRLWPAEWVGSAREPWLVWWTALQYMDIDRKQDDDHREQARIAKIRANDPRAAFRARTGIENISGVEDLILKQFNNNATRSRSDFSIRVRPDYLDGLAFFGYRWDSVLGTIRDKEPFVVVCPDILGSQRWVHDIPVAFPVAYRERLTGVNNAWLFDLDKGVILPADPKESAVSAALASWKSLKNT